MMNVQQISEDQFLTLSINMTEKTDIQTLDFGSMLIMKASDGEVLIQSAFDSKYLLIIQD